MNICSESSFLLQYFDLPLENQKAMWVFASLRVSLYNPQFVLTTAIRMLRDGEMRSLFEIFSVEFGNKVISSWIAELGEYKLVFVGCQLGTAKHEPS